MELRFPSEDGFQDATNVTFSQLLRTVMRITSIISMGYYHYSRQENPCEVSAEVLNL